MKNQILFLSLLLFTIACNKSEESTTTFQEPITFQEKVIGEWQISSFVINSCPNASDNLAFTSSDEDGCLDIMGETSCVSILIFENGPAEAHDRQSDAVEQMTYEIDEINNTINLCEELDDCLTLKMDADGLYNEMDEGGCICVIGFKRM